MEIKEIHELRYRIDINEQERQDLIQTVVFTNHPELNNIEDLFCYIIDFIVSNRFQLLKPDMVLDMPVDAAKQILLDALAQASSPPSLADRLQTEREIADFSKEFNNVINKPSSK